MDDFANLRVEVKLLKDELHRERMKAIGKHLETATTADELFSLAEEFGLFEICSQLLVDFGSLPSETHPLDLQDELAAVGIELHQLFSSDEDDISSCPGPALVELQESRCFRAIDFDYNGRRLIWRTAIDRTDDPEDTIDGTISIFQPPDTTLFQVSISVDPSEPLDQQVTANSLTFFRPGRWVLTLIEVGERLSTARIAKWSQDEDNLLALPMPGTRNPHANFDFAVQELLADEKITVETRLEIQEFIERKNSGDLDPSDEAYVVNLHKRLQGGKLQIG